MTANQSAARTRHSKVLAEARREDQARMPTLPPQRRMEMVFLMSMDALRLHRAGLRAQGLPDTDFRKRRKARQG